MNQVSIGSDNGVLPIRGQAIIWTSAGLLSIGPLGTNFSEILTKIQNFSFTKMHMKICEKAVILSRERDKLRNIFRFESKLDNWAQLFHFTTSTLNIDINTLIVWNLVTIENSLWPYLPKFPQCKPTDLWQIGKHMTTIKQLRCWNSLSNLTIYNGFHTGASLLQLKDKWFTWHQGTRTDGWRNGGSQK